MDVQLTAAMEIAYWLFVKSFGLPMKNCHYETCTQHLVQGAGTSALMISTGWRFYLVAHRYLNLPIPD